MRNRVRFLGGYIAFWVAYFIVGRVIFLAYEGKKLSHLSADLIVGIPLHGLKLDISAAAWLSVLPFAVISRSGFIPPRAARWIITAYTGIMVFVTTVLLVTDMELFAAWGTRLDTSVLPYLTTPKEALEVTGSSPLVLLFGILVAMTALGLIAYRRFVLPLHDDNAQARGEESLGVLIMLTLLVIPIRGGIEYVALSQSSVYFSQNDVANRAALNPAWNFVTSLQTRPADRNDFRFTTDASATHIVDSLLGRTNRPAEASGTTSPRLLRMRPKTIVFIIWESLTSKIVEPLGGMPGITPNLSRLAHDGILFSGIYASGERTPKGLPALLSGFPAQPMAMVIESADKSAALPSLSRSLSGGGYHTAFFHGGNPDFVNIRRYLLSTHFDRVIERSELRGNLVTIGLGVPDHIVLERMLTELRSAPRPVFFAVLTLSSHEPYNVPMTPVFEGRSPSVRFLNAHVYTDRSVGSFVDHAKRESWWDSALVIITADHGNREPEGPGMFLHAKEQYSIPMLWLGGALAVRDTIIPQIASQTDIPKTLLSQLGLRSDDFRWSKDFLAPGVPPFAYYSFPGLFGYVDDAGSYVFDNVSRSVVYSRGSVTGAAIAAGRAFQQVAVQGYLDLGHPPRLTQLH
jgi:phosphoglycerol transferase MdoB-like AlkP superfamily enzyme